MPCRMIATEEQCVTTVNEAPLPQARRRPSIGHQESKITKAACRKRVWILIRTYFLGRDSAVDFAFFSSISRIMTDML